MQTHKLLVAKLTQYIPKLNANPQTDTKQINSTHSKLLKCPY